MYLQNKFVFTLTSLWTVWTLFINDAFLHCFMCLGVHPANQQIPAFQYSVKSHCPLCWNGHISQINNTWKYMEYICHFMPAKCVNIFFLGHCYILTNVSCAFCKISIVNTYSTFQTGYGPLCVSQSVISMLLLRP